MRRRPGVALVVVLLGLGALALIAASVGGQARDAAALARNLEDAAAAQAAADGAVRLALARLAADPRGTPIDGAPIALIVGDAPAEAALRDVNGLVDLNAADQTLLTIWLRWAGAPTPELFAARLLDWRDADDAPGPDGAESAAYAAAGLRAPLNRPFEIVDELRLVIGMTPELFARLAPSATVLSRRNALDPAAAPPDLAALLRFPQSPYLSQGGREIVQVRATARRGTAAARRTAFARFTGDAKDPFWLQSWSRW